MLYFTVDQRIIIVSGLKFQVVQPETLNFKLKTKKNEPNHKFHPNDSPSCVPNERTNGGK
jgi:hypothetical protein